MKKTLPARPNLEHLKAQAKDLLQAAHRADATALERIQRELPAARAAGESVKLALHDAQSVIAREYGFASFAELRKHVLAIEQPALTHEMVHALMQRHMAVPPPSEVQAALLAATRPALLAMPSLAAPLPVLAVRNALLTQGAVAPFNIGRPASVAAIEAALASGGSIAVFSQKNETHEDPNEADLHSVGCVAHVSAFLRTEERGSWVILKALAWVRLDALVSSSPHLSARVSELAIREEDADEEARLRHELLARVRALSSGLPSAEQIVRMLDDMTALELADATVANLYCSVEDKARYAAESSLTRRLRAALALVASA
jgi:Lon protease-like protein